MLQTGRAEKVDKKNGVIWVVFMFPSWVIIEKKHSFFNFVILKQFTYMRLKGFITRLPKIALLWYDLMFWRY